MKLNCRTLQTLHSPVHYDVFAVASHIDEVHGFEIELQNIANIALARTL